MQGLDDEYWVPEHVRAWLRSLGFSLPLEDMEPHIRAWDRWMRALGDFYDYRDTDGVGRVYEVHRRSIHPAMRVCREWGSLLLNDRTQVACAEQACTDWLAAWMARTGFLASAQECVVRAFGLGTGAWALWVDAGAGEVRVRRYDARMVVPLTWDEEGVTECAFVTRAFWRGRAVDQVQLHLKGAADAFFSPGESSASDPLSAGSSRLTDDASKGTYRIVTTCFDRDGKGGRVSIPFGRQDCTVFRKVMSTEDAIHEFAPTLRTEAQARAFRVALLTLGDLCGFGINYFDLENVGYVKTATEVSADNSALMRNIRRHEHALEGAIAGICRALLAAERRLGVELPDEGLVRVTFDDSIITDTTAEKRQDMDEVAAGLLEPWEYRAKWRGEDEATARRGAARSGPSRARNGAEAGGLRTTLDAQRTAVAAPRVAADGSTSFSSFSSFSSAVKEAPRPSTGPRALRKAAGRGHVKNS